MAKINFKTAHFVKTAVKPEQYPVITNSKGHTLPEIAFAGRSNVGKSSLLNHLLQRKKLARTSSTPGKTRELQFFSIDNAFSLADLPGYGYAKVSGNIRKNWAPMMESYVTGRQELRLVLFLLDVRRTPNQDDLRFLEWITQRGIPLVLVLTKVDKLKANPLRENTKKILATLDLITDLPYVHYSSTKNIGRQQLIQHITNTINPQGTPG